MNLRPAFGFKTFFVAFVYLSIALTLLSRETYAGTLDPMFGTGGKVTVDFPFSSQSNYSSYGYYTFTQPSGRIVGAGIHYQQGPDGLAPGVALVGLTGGGVVDTNYNGGKTLDWEAITSASLNDAFMLSDGRVLRLSSYFPVFGTRRINLVRINVDGMTDGAFTPDLNINGDIPYGRQLCVLSNGKILVLVEHSSTRRLYLIRLNSDGGRDATFGTGGAKELVRLGSQSDGITFSITTAMEILPNGKIVMAGGMGYSGNTNDFAEAFFVRLDADGNMDHSFGQLGRVRYKFANRIYPTGMLVQNGRYLITGLINTPDRDTLMARFTHNGRLDTSFGNTGVVVTDFAVDGSDYFNNAALTGDGKIIVVGQADAVPTTISNFLVARFSANGVLEAHTKTAFTPAQNSGAQNVSIQPDGKILVIGYTKNPNTSISGNVFAIARYTAITND
jgi:uncharacterized delta-60 repeat protein